MTTFELNDRKNRRNYLQQSIDAETKKVLTLLQYIESESGPMTDARRAVDIIRLAVQARIDALNARDANA